MDNQQLELFSSVLTDEHSLNFHHFVAEDRHDRTSFPLDSGSQSNVVHFIEKYRKETSVSQYDSSLIKSIITRAKLF